MRERLSERAALNAANDRRRAALLDSQRRVLERIATGAPLEEVLHTLVKLIEEQAGHMRCAVLLADAAQTRLRFAAAPSLPHELKAAMGPFLAIAPDKGSCAAAAYRRQPVYARDTATDPLWESGRDILLHHGVHATWSTPILADDNRVLGTFAMYYGEPCLPTDEHVQLIDMAVQMARVAIEAKADHELLRISYDNAPRAMVVTDLGGTIGRANHAFARLLGYTPADLQGKSMAQIAERDNTALVKELTASNKELSSDRRYRTRDGRVLRIREYSSLRRDASGEPQYVVTHVDPLSDGAECLQRLSRRERQVLELVVAGHTSKQIGARLGISPASVDTYRSRIMVKLDVENLSGLLRLAIRYGIAHA